MNQDMMCHAKIRNVYAMQAHVIAHEKLKLN